MAGGFGQVAYCSGIRRERIFVLFFVRPPCRDTNKSQERKKTNKKFNPDKLKIKFNKFKSSKSG